jgi:Cu-Zn family superoxide dismutase
MRQAGLIVGVLLALGGCAGAGSPTRAIEVGAELRDESGRTVGTATFAEEDGRVRLTVQATGLPPGLHGIHVHAVGKCEAPGFTSAGGHHNPLGRKHGLAAADGPHSGDLPNLEADQAGLARYQARTDLLTLRDGPTSVFDADGSALVIHAKADDQRTDPTGDSGGRLACGVIVRR